MHFLYAIYVPFGVVQCYYVQIINFKCLILYDFTSDDLELEKSYFQTRSIKNCRRRESSIWNLGKHYYCDRLLPGIRNQESMYTNPEPAEV